MSTCHVSKRSPRCGFFAFSNQGNFFVPVSPQEKWDEIHEGSRLVYTLSGHFEHGEEYEHT